MCSWTDSGEALAPGRAPAPASPVSDIEGRAPDGVLSVAVLGPGGVGGLVAAALARAGQRVRVVASPSTARLIAERGVQVDSVRMGRFTARPTAVSVLAEDVDVLVVATKAVTLLDALERIEGCPALVVPLLNGLDHMTPLRRRFGGDAAGHSVVAAGAIRVEADRPHPGTVVQTSQFLRVDMASDGEALRPALARWAAVLEGAGVPARVLDSEAQVIWSKLVRLNALACTTSAFARSLGPIRSTPRLRSELIGAVTEGVAVARAEGARASTEEVMAELTEAHATLSSSLARDIEARRPPELDAIAGAVLRAAGRHGIPCPTIERLVSQIVRRTGLAAPRRQA